MEPILFRFSNNTFYDQKLISNLTTYLEENTVEELLELLKETESNNFLKKINTYKSKYRYKEDGWNEVFLYHENLVFGELLLMKEIVSQFNEHKRNKINKFELSLCGDKWHSLNLFSLKFVMESFKKEFNTDYETTMEELDDELGEEGYANIRINW